MFVSFMNVEVRLLLSLAAETCATQEAPNHDSVLCAEIPTF